VDILFHTLVYNDVLLFCGTWPLNLLFRMFEFSLLSIVNSPCKNSSARQEKLAVRSTEALIQPKEKLLVLIILILTHAFVFLYIKLSYRNWNIFRVKVQFFFLFDSMIP